MIHIQGFGIDVKSIRCLLARNNLRARITSDEIFIYTNDVPSQVVQELIKLATIVTVKNYDKDILEDSFVQQPDFIQEQQQEEGKQVENVNAELAEANFEKTSCESKLVVIHNEEELKSSRRKVYRGEVYELKAKESKTSQNQYVIILQNDSDNDALSDNVIAILCTTKHNEHSSFGISFRLSVENMQDYKERNTWGITNTNFVVSKVVGVERYRLGEFFGTLRKSFMRNLYSGISKDLGLEDLGGARDLNWVQLELLRNVNMNDLFEISDSLATDEEKVDELLSIFGFDMNANGMNYLKQSILIAKDLVDYKLITLAKAIDSYSAQKIEKTIIARVKENFKSKTSPTMDFIRLIVRFLKRR